MNFKHIPVLLNETLEGLNIYPSGVYLDCTLGGAGHSSEIVKLLNSQGILIGFDKDAAAISASKKRLSEIATVFIYNQETLLFETDDINIKNSYNLDIKEFSYFQNIKTNKPICILVKEDFKNSLVFLEKMNLSFLNGILIDLGVSSYQIDNSERGFSFRADAPLDMRMDQSKPLTAKYIINNYSENDLLQIFYKYGEEEFSKSIVKNIIIERDKSPIETTKELNNIIERSMPAKVVFSRGGAAKKVFQALRIEVNSELIGLEDFLKNAVSFLSPGGRFCIISFHSLEDRIVKEVFKFMSLKCICPSSFPKCVCDKKEDLKILTKKPITANEQELKINSRSASAKLRIAEKK